MKTLLISILISIATCSNLLAGNMPPAKVVTAPIIQKEVAQNAKTTGILYYERVSNISSETAGLVKNVMHKLGDRVKKGQPLLSINTDILDQEISLVKNKIEQLVLTSRHAEKDYKRLEKLFTSQGVSEKRYDDALYVFKTAELEKKSLEIELEKLKLKKKKSVIYAPFNGIVLEKNVDQGDWVLQGKQLFRIGSSNDLMVKVSVNETLVPFIAIGQQVPVTIIAFNKKISGTINDFFPVADQQTKNVVIKIEIPSLPLAAANMSARVFIPKSKSRKLSIIPRDALIKFQGKDFVYTVKDSKAAILPVNIVAYFHNSVGADNPYFVPGMPLIIEGNERLRPDQAVSISQSGDQ